jgi:hypothetical protein
MHAMHMRTMRLLHAAHQLTHCRTHLLCDLAAPVGGLLQDLVEVYKDVVLQEKLKDARLILVAPQDVLWRGDTRRHTSSTLHWISAQCSSSARA